MERHEVEAVVIGAGVVGLACAAALARAGRETIILERARLWGGETSSRSSEVIHAGIYYPPHMLKARLCVEGRARLYGYAAARGVAHRRIGKLIVATDAAEEPKLEALAAQGAACGVRLEALTGDQARRLAPGLKASAALLSPETGLIDSHGLMRALLGEAEDHGAALALGARVEGGELLSDGRFLLRIGGESPILLVARSVVNAAGLWAQEVAGAMESFGPRAIPPLVMLKGNYFSYAGRAPFDRLIYPLPPPGGLGAHLTLDLGGRARFGPDVEPVAALRPDDLDYGVDPGRAGAFEESIRRWWPGLPENALRPDYAGVRPKLARDNSADFRIETPRPGWVDLFGIESPGLTASLALAEHVIALL